MRTGWKVVPAIALLLGAVWIVRFRTDSVAGASRTVAAEERRPWFFPGLSSSAATESAASEPEGAAARREIHGSVLDAVTGAPVPAEVRLLRGERIVDAVWTDDGGTFAFPPTAERIVRIAAKADGHSIAMQWIGTQDRYELRLDRAARVSGRVVDGRNDGVAGAWVVAYDVDGYVEPYPQSEKVETGPDGSFEIADSPSGEIEVAASKEGFRRDTHRIGPLGPGRTEAGITLTLLPGGSIAGRVTAAGRAVPGAFVRAYLEATIGGDEPLRPRQTTSDGDGRFGIADLEPGPWTVLVHDRVEGTAAVRLEVAAGADANREIALQPAGIVEGRVLSAAGEPVADAEVSLFPAGNAVFESSRYPDEAIAILGRYRTTLQMRTDADGRFAFRNVLSVRARLHLERPFGPSRSRRIRADVEVPARDLLLRFASDDTGETIDGRVVDRNGSVWTGNGNVGIEGPMRMSVPVKSGAFEIVGAESGDYRVTFRGDDASDSDPAGLAIVPGRSASITLVRRAPGVAKGRLVAAGRPVAGAHVGIAREDRWGSVFEASLEKTNAARSDPNGRFSVPVPAGGATLYAYHPEFRPWVRRDVRVEADSVRDLGALELAPGRGTTRASLRGDVGFALRLERDRFLVSEWGFDPTGPGSIAGIAIGEEIRSLDEIALDGLSEEAANERLDGEPDTMVTVEIDSTPPRQVALRRREKPTIRYQVIRSTD